MCGIACTNSHPKMAYIIMRQFSLRQEYFQSIDANDPAVNPAAMMNNRLTVMFDLVGSPS
jgi:hypothetical protein